MLTHCIQFNSNYEILFVCLKDFPNDLKRVAQDDTITATSIICDVAAAPQGIKTTKCKKNVFKVTWAIMSANEPSGSSGQSLSRFP